MIISFKLRVRHRCFEGLSSAVILQRGKADPRARKRREIRGEFAKRCVVERDCPEKGQKLRTVGNSVTLLRITSTRRSRCNTAGLGRAWWFNRKQRKYKMNYDWNVHVCVAHLLWLIREKCTFAFPRGRCFNLAHFYSVQFRQRCRIRYIRRPERA